MHPAGQRPLCHLAISYVVLHTNRIQKSSRIIADAGRRDFSPEVAAVLAPNSLFDRVTIDFAGELTPEFPDITVDIFRQRLLKNGPAHQLGRRMAGQLA